MRIDAHQHFWRYDRVQYPWIPAGSPLELDWLPADLAPLLAAGGFDGCVAVQARQTAEETRWLLDLADRSPVIKGVVGWVDLCADTLERELGHWAAHPQLRGVRHVAQDETDDGFLARSEVIRGVGRLAAFGLTFDLLIYARQLPAAIKLVRALPEQTFVLDHIGKPAIARGQLSPWQDQLQELARSPNVFCKVSGLVTEAHHRAWQPSDLRPFLDVAFDAFGPERLMYGSDWPVCLLAADYARQLAILSEYVAQNCASAAANIFGSNAGRAYGLT